MQTGQTDLTACIFNIQKFSIHDGPGIRTAVFFKGCPLRCRWCSNPESQSTGVQSEHEPAMAGREYTLEETLALCLADRDFYEESGGGVTLTGGEVLVQADFAAELLRLLELEGIHTAVETSGFASEDAFLKVADHSGMLLYDLKHYDSARHREGTQRDNRPILANLQTAVERGKEVLVRIPVIPGYNDSLCDAREFARLIRQFGLTRAQLLPFHQFGQKKYETLGMPYTMGDVRTLYTEDLQEFRQEMLRAGVHCI